MWALYAREVKRFQKIMLDTVFSPIMSVILYLAIFGVVLGERSVEGIPFLTFVYSGLLTMLVVNSSFSSPAFAFVIGKNTGTFIDLQLVPIKAWRIGLAYALAAFTRGFLTLIVAILLTSWFIPAFTITHPLLLLLGLFLTGLEFGMLGVLFGLWAKSFESLTFITTFVMQPMIFLAGVFYPISQLPTPWNTLSSLNPLHHNINLMRYGFTGYADMSPWVSFGVMVLLSFVLFILMWQTAQRKIRNVS